MARPRKLTAQQEQQIADLTAEVGPREASRRAPEVVGCPVSPATCSRLEQQAGAAQEGPLRPEAADTTDEVTLPDDDLEALLLVRKLAAKAALTATEKRLLLSALDRIVAVTTQIIKLREQHAPQHQVGILILPVETP